MTAKPSPNCQGHCEVPGELAACFILAFLCDMAVDINSTQSDLLHLSVRLSICVLVVGIETRPPSACEPPVRGGCSVSCELASLWKSRQRSVNVCVGRPSHLFLSSELLWLGLRQTWPQSFPLGGLGWLLSFCVLREASELLVDEEGFGKAQQGPGLVHSSHVLSLDEET